MARSVRPIPIGPFLGGLNTRKIASLIDPGAESQALTDVNLFDGSIAGTLGEGTVVSGVIPPTLSNPGFLRLIQGYAWLLSAAPQFALDDAGQTYVTRRGARPIVATPLWPPNGTNLDTYPTANQQVVPLLGCVAPIVSLDAQSITWSVGTVASGGLSGSFAFGLTYLFADGTESNMQSALIVPEAFDGSTKGSMSFASVWPNDPRVVAVQMWRTQALSATQIAAATAGTLTNQQLTFFRIMTVGGTTGTNNTRGIAYSRGGFGPNIAEVPIDAGDVSDTTLATNPMLTWTPGGFPAQPGISGVVQPQYIDDHSPAPPLTCLSDRLHSVAAGAGSAGSGIVVGAVGSLLVWARLAFPYYWPLANSQRLDSHIEAIFSYTGYTIVFTQHAIYRLYGERDDQLQLERLNAQLPILKDWGTAVSRTRLGVFYAAQEGLCLFQGGDSQVVSAGKLPQNYFTGKTAVGATWSKQILRVYHTTGYLQVDLRDGVSGAKFSEQASGDGHPLAVTTAAWRAPVIASSLMPLAVSATNQGLGMRRGGLISDNANAIYWIGGTNALVTSSSAATVETVQQKIYGLVVPNNFFGANTFSAGSAAWISLAATGFTGVCDVDPFYLNGKLYVFCGSTTGDTQGGHLNNQMQVFDTTMRTWAADATLPGSWKELQQYAACADTTGGDTTHGWIAGGIASGLAFNYVLEQYAPAAGGSYTDIDTTFLGASGPARGGSMVFVPGSAFADNRARLFYFFKPNPGGSTAGTATVVVRYAKAATTDFTQTGGGTVTDSTTGPAAGVAWRNFHRAVYDAQQKKILIFGGQGADLAALGDMWIFDPVAWVTNQSPATTGSPPASAASAIWPVHVPDIGIGPRYKHGACMIAVSSDERLFVAGGTSDDNTFHSDAWQAIVQQTKNWSASDGPYHVNSGPNVVPFETGTALAWSHQTADFIAEAPGGIVEIPEMWLDYQGTITVQAVNDGGAAITLFTATSATRTQTRFFGPFTGGAAARGKRVSLIFSDGATGSILYPSVIQLSEANNVA